MSYMAAESIVRRYFSPGVEQSWNIYELPIGMQKPLEIRKNSPSAAWY